MVSGILVLEEKSLMSKKFIIAIDGPAASGKSTTAQLLASRLGYVYLDTGAMYRACALKAMRYAISLDDLPAVENMLRDLNLRVEIGAGKNRIILDGEDVSELIRGHEISALASAISALPMVRYRMVELQREIAKDGGYILDGRDIGTFVFPNADIKFYLEAAVEERAKRRLAELVAKGVTPDYATVLNDLIARDRNDQSRSLAPLCKASDAIVIDTTELSIDQQVDALYQIVVQKQVAS